MDSTFKPFPATSSLFKVAVEVNDEINKATQNSVYLNIPVWLALSPFFTVALIPTLLADSVFHIFNIFDLTWESIMSLKDFIKNEVPEGIKKIAVTLGLAVGGITLVNLVSGSVYAVFFTLKVTIVLAALTHIALVIKQNMPNMLAASEALKEKLAAFFDNRRTNISNFFKAFTFRVKKETGTPVVSGEESAAPAEYDYFPYMPSRTDLYKKLPGNPFSWLFSRTSAQAQPLSGMAGNNNVLDSEESAPDSPSNRLSPTT